ncbi:MAG: M50 family metallopeptidase [Terriglobales bacterium]
MARSGSIRLARIAGIELSLHWTWFFVLLLELQDRGRAYSSPIWNLYELVALFAIVTLHEFGHALACRQVGGHADHIMLWPFGGIAFVDPPVRPGATLWTIAAGPLVNVALFPILYLAARSTQTLAMAFEHRNLFIFVTAVFYINFALLVFNLFPVYPLDGGQILQALLWFPLGRARSLMAATVIGLLGDTVLFIWAFAQSDYWLVAISIFILFYCWSGLKHSRHLWQLAKMRHHAGFACPWCRSAPVAAPLWNCANCHANLDAFATAACPVCAAAPQQAQCPECGHLYPLSAWRAGTVDAAVISR